MTYDDYECLLVEKDGHLATVTLNRPERRNAINDRMHHELARIWVDLAQDDDVFAVLVTGAGSTFSVGGDVSKMGDSVGGDVVADGAMPDPAHARRIVYNLLDLDKPVVCAINGHAIGLAATIALMCDITVASTTAKIADTHVKVGLVAGDGGAAIWPLLVGPSRAKELLMRGLILDGTEAERIGLVNHAVPVDEVLPFARDIALELANGPTWAIRWTKLSVNKLLKQQLNLVFDTSMALEMATFHTEDHREAVRAFMESARPSSPVGERRLRMDMSVNAGALAGIRVLDLTAVLAGPFAARMLADNGAEVIKVEPPGGDLMRTRPPLRDGHSSYYGALNCGKRSIVLDLKHSDGRAIAIALARTADVVIENFRPGVVKQLGLDYEVLSAENPRLVYCSISGFGQTGPSARRPAYAPIIHAASGYDVANLRAQDATDRPANTGIFLADVLGAVYAFGAIQTALLHRERTGVGQSVDVSMLEAVVSLLVSDVQEAQFATDRRRPVYPPLKTLDGGHIVVAPTTPRNFAALCAAIDRPELLEDPRFATIGARGQHWELLLSLIEDWTSTRTAEACEEILCSGGVPCSRYRAIADALRDPQLAHRGALVEVDDDAGPFLVPNQPYLMSETPAQARSYVAVPGADADQILRDLLDCTDEDIAGWRASGAVGDRQPEQEHA